MSMPSRKSKRKKIRESLVDQLQAKGADTPFYVDLVDRYMQLWDAVEDMQEDIRTKGRRYMAFSASGNEYEKENENIKMIPSYLKQMQSLLSDMKLSPDNLIRGDEPDDEL